MIFDYLYYFYINVFSELEPLLKFLGYNLSSDVSINLQFFRYFLELMNDFQPILIQVIF